MRVALGLARGSSAFRRSVREMPGRVARCLQLQATQLLPFCPSCGARRRAETVALLGDEVPAGDADAAMGAACRLRWFSCSRAIRGR
jgi:hypothetical protein